MKKIFDYEKAGSSGSYTIDMIMNCIYFYRKRQKPIETIYLNTYHWSKVLEFVEIAAKVDVMEVGSFEFDGVKLKKNPLRSNDEISVAFYQAVEKEEEVKTSKQAEDDELGLGGFPQEEINF